jgi:hypothetical protein
MIKVVLINVVVVVVVVIAVVVVAAVVKIVVVFDKCIQYYPRHEGHLCDKPLF